MATTTATRTSFLILTEEDDRRKFTVAPGCVIYALLSENAGSTGYAWHYQPSNMADAPVIEDYDRFSPGREDLMGASGVHLFALRVPRPPRASSDQELRFVRQRGSEAPVQALHYQVHVAEG